MWVNSLEVISLLSMFEKVCSGFLCEKRLSSLCTSSYIVTLTHYRVCLLVCVCECVPGHCAAEQLISQPRAVCALSLKHCSVRHVACSEAATVVATSRGDVFVLHEYQCRKIVSSSRCQIMQSVCLNCSDVC